MDDGVTGKKKGLLMVFTGDGKGKTTAALGMALRASGHGMKTLVLQFIKGNWRYGELAASDKIPEIALRPLGSGFTWLKRDLAEDRQLAEAGWTQVEEALQSGEYDLIVLDELNVALSYGLLPVDKVVQSLERRPASLHVAVTGRGAPEELIRAADLVTEMRALKHPYADQGIKAQPGIEY